jgi:predicted phage-related endonuclease
MKVEKRLITSREEWLSWRREDVTASAAPALFGVHPYMTALKLYAEKRGTEFLVEDNKVLRRGRWMEPAVAKAVMEECPQWTLKPGTEYFRAPAHRLGATPDFHVLGDPRGVGILQAKSVAPSVYARDWNDGKEVPLWIILQAVTEAMLTDAAFIVIAALLVDAHNMDLATHVLERNPAAEEKIIKAVAQFWNDVAHGHEPPPDFARDADTVKAIWKRERAPDAEVDLTGLNHLPVLLEERATLKLSEKRLGERLDEIDTELKFLMKDAAIATGLNGWRMTYKTSHIKGYTVKERDSRILRVTDQRDKV